MDKSLDSTTGYLLENASGFNAGSNNTMKVAISSFFVFDIF